jgi:hypothetical protein
MYFWAGSVIKSSQSFAVILRSEEAQYKGINSF